MSYRITTLEQSPHLKPQIERLHDGAWSQFICEFMRTDPTIVRQWDTLLSKFARYQILLESASTLIALGHTVPFYWNCTIEGLPTGWSNVLQRGTEPSTSIPSNTLSALAIIVAPQYQGQGLSQTVLQAMKRLGAEHKFASLIAPVRPILKHHYPLIPMEEYLQWQRAGHPFDPWIRVHYKAGANVLCVAPKSMTIAVPIAQWEAWTNLCFLSNGEYVVPGALSPIVIDREIDQGLYQEANIWMQHSIP